jgi:hypothetical protein
MAKRKQSQAQLDNLKLGEGFNSTEIARKAQEKSVKARAEYKSLKQRIMDNVTPEQWNEMIAALVAKGMSGDVRAFEILRDTAGEKPSDKVELDGGMAFYLDGIGDDISG